MKTKVKGKAAKSRDVEVHTNRLIHSKDGKELGKIVEVVYTPDRSKIRYAVIDFGEPYISQKKSFLPFPGMQSSSAKPALASWTST